jgi:hypothetical protein
MSALITLASLLLLPLMARAQKAPEPLAQEAFLGSLSFMQERGEVQIRSLVRTGGTRSRPTALAPVEFELGITNSLELNLESGGSRYQRPGGWSSPTEAGLGVGLRFGGQMIERLHSAVSLEVASEPGEASGDARATTLGLGIQLGIDFPRLRAMHLFTSAGIERPLRNATGHETEWAAGIVVPVGPFRGTLEHQLIPSEENPRVTVPGVIWKVSGWEFGIATTIASESPTRPRGLLLSALVEF